MIMYGQNKGNRLTYKKEYESEELYEMKKPYIVITDEDYEIFSEEENLRRWHPVGKILEYYGMYVLDLRGR